MTAPAGPFTLTARADRIDVGEQGLIITDYKTAQSLQQLAKRALDGEAPQLLLEAAIAAENGFANVPAGTVALLRYISTSGGEPPGQDVVLKLDDVAASARTARDGLARLISEFDNETTLIAPYAAPASNMTTTTTRIWHALPNGPSAATRKMRHEAVRLR